VVDQERQASNQAEGPVVTDTSVEFRRLDVRGPSPALQAPPAGQDPSSKPLRPGLVLAALAVGLAAATGLFAWNQAPAVGDHSLSAQQVQQRVATFQAHGPAVFTAVTTADRNEAFRSMALSAADLELLRNDLDGGRTRLVWITLWDDLVEDGDVVEIRSAGFTKVIALTKTPHRVAVPVPASGGIEMKGMRDGGGGITVAAQTDRGVLAIPVMAPGQTITVPIAR
jgi:hypothetical protein